MKVETGVLPIGGADDPFPEPVLREPAAAIRKSEISCRLANLTRRG
jgi:hypothetical protein